MIRERIAAGEGAYGIQTLYMGHEQMKKAAGTAAVLQALIDGSSSFVPARR
jgi:hypothetical protein